MAWLDMHAGSVQAVASAVQALVTAILVAITVWYARSTHDMSERSEKMVRAIEEQRQDAARPVLVAEIQNPAASYRSVSIRVGNIGAGPALAVVVELHLAPNATTTGRWERSIEKRLLIGIQAGVWVEALKLKAPDDNVVEDTPQQASAWVVVHYDDVFKNHWRLMLPLWRDGQQYPMRIIPETERFEIEKVPSRDADLPFV